MELDVEDRYIENIDLTFQTEYTAGLSIAIDANLAYGKSAFLSAKSKCLQNCFSFNKIVHCIYVVLLHILLPRSYYSMS